MNTANVLQDIKGRLEVAEAEHTIAKHRLATFEGNRNGHHYQALKDRVDRTLTHQRIMKIAVLQAELKELEAIQRAEEFDKRNPRA
jgi:hypothetical protein